MSNNREKTNSKEPAIRQILFLWNYLEWGGVQIYFLGLMRSAAKKYRVKAILPKGSNEKILSYLKANNIEYEFFEGSLDLKDAGTFVRQIKRRFNDFLTNLSLAKHLAKCDLKNSIVQIDVAPWAGLTLLVYLVLRTNVFVTFHTAIPPLSVGRKFLWKAKFLFITAFKNFHLAASNLDVKKSLRPFVSEARYQQIEVIYSSVNTKEIEKVFVEEISKREVAEKYDFPADKIWICNVAQFIERKGCWVFLEAIEILQKERGDLFFYWLGTADLPTETIEKIEKYNLRNNFRFLSANDIGATRKDLLALWKAAEIFALPSFQEGLPVALVEAMALGKACIASEINAIPEAVKNFETGILVAAGDSRKLAETISQLANDFDLQKRLGAAARKFALENFDETITGQKMLELYEKSAG